MKQSTKFGLGIAFATGLTVAAGSFAYYQLRDSEAAQNKRKGKEALDYLQEKYGEEIMEGKRIEILED